MEGSSYSYSNASESTLNNMGKYLTRIHQERLY